MLLSEELLSQVKLIKPPFFRLINMIKLACLANLCRRPILLPSSHAARSLVCHTVALPFTLKRTLRQKKELRNSNISPCKNIIFKKSSKGNQNSSRYYNSRINLKFQHKPRYHLRKILI
jgi:hypothetical protein